jgi:hypothetical protein
MTPAAAHSALRGAAWITGALRASSATFTHCASIFLVNLKISSSSNPIKKYSFSS